MRPGSTGRETAHVAFTEWLFIGRPDTPSFTNMGGAIDAAGFLNMLMRNHVGAINWGFAKGKTQTNLPWDSWQRPYVLQQPPVWFHDIFYPDGKPYREREVQIIRKATGVAK